MGPAPPGRARPWPRRPRPLVVLHRRARYEQSALARPDVKAELDLIYRLVIPATFENNDAVRVLEWHAVPGDTVRAGALIVEVETHKALIEVRAGQDGVLRQQHRDEGEWLPLGESIATLSDASDEPMGADTREMPVEFVIG